MVKVQLFVTCLGEQFFSQTLKDMVTVLERLGVQCEFPEGQTCCGQPFYNSGFQSRGRDLAQRWIDVFDRSDGYIVSPSGSCVDMIKEHYEEIFPPGSSEHERVESIVSRTFEFSQFLVNVLHVTDVGARFPHKVTYHASCHLLRGLGVSEEPKRLLRAVQGLELVPLKDEETCCGFGGAFSVIYPEVSGSMVAAKVNNIIDSGAEVVVVGDGGCIMNIGGALRKLKSPVKAMHYIEVLASQ